MNLVNKLSIEHAPAASVPGVFSAANMHKIAYYIDKFNVFTDGTGYCYAYKSSFRSTWVIVECTIGKDNLPFLFDVLKQTHNSSIYINNVYGTLFSTDLIEAYVDKELDPPTLHYKQDYFNLSFGIPHLTKYQIGLKILK
jgi:hypothetical protein